MQLEAENQHLRRLLHIPNELFIEDPDEIKAKEKAKKMNVLKSIDEKLKSKEKKLQKK